MSAPEWKAGDRAVVEVAEDGPNNLGWVKVEAGPRCRTPIHTSALSPLPAGGLGPLTESELREAELVWRELNGERLALGVTINHVLAARAAQQPGVDAEGLGEVLYAVWSAEYAPPMRRKLWTAVARAAMRECGRAEAPAVADPYEAALCVREDASPTRTAQIAEANARVAEAAEEWAAAPEMGPFVASRWAELKLALSHRRAILAPPPAPDAVGELVAAAEHAADLMDGSSARQSAGRSLREAIAVVKAQREPK